MVRPVARFLLLALRRDRRVLLRDLLLRLRVLPDMAGGSLDVVGKFVELRGTPRGAALHALQALHLVEIGKNLLRDLVELRIVRHEAERASCSPRASVLARPVTLATALQPRRQLRRRAIRRVSSCPARPSSLGGGPQGFA